ncbi:sugar nucleotide-binding protein [Micrococcus luteus]|nr:sugar nucleotide-binding protein [Micrococcus luteus]
MKITETPIPGLLVLDLDVHGDNRGWFKENWQREKLRALAEADPRLAGLQPVQNNISFNDAVGTTRGIHAEPWDKYVSVAHGRIFGAWVDLRAGESFGAVATVELGPEKAVFVPRGVGNSYQTLQPDTAYTYLVNDHWSADAQGQYTFLNLADPTAAIAWPIPLGQAELSDKDRAHPMLADVTPMPPAPILVLGAGGQLGRALVARAEEAGIPVEAHDRSTWDLAAPETWPRDHFRGLRAVINASAMTAVDHAESPEGRAEAWAVNAAAVAELARRCADAGVPLAHVSTDYVFDGTVPVGQDIPVDQPLAPLGVYGQSKAAGEAAVRVLPRHWIVRTSWVIGEGRNFVATMAALAEKGVDPAVVADQHGRLTFADDLADALLHLVTTDAPAGTYHMTNSGDVVTWHDVARWVFEDTGHDAERVSATTTAAYLAGKEGVAPRPTNSALDLGPLAAVGYTAPDQRERLRDHLSETTGGTR